MFDREVTFRSTLLRQRLQWDKPVSATILLNQLLGFGALVVKTENEKVFREEMAICVPTILQQVWILKSF